MSVRGDIAVEISHLALKDFPLHACVCMKEAWDKLPFLSMEEREMRTASVDSIHAFGRFRFHASNFEFPPKST